MSVAETILQKIASLVQDHIKLIWGLSHELKKLEFIVSLIQAIQDEHRESNHNRVDQVCLQNLDKIMKEITGVLEYFEGRVNNGGGSGGDNDKNDDDDDDEEEDKPILIKKEEDGCLAPLSYFLSNPVVWVRDGFMAGKIKSIRQRLIDNFNDKKLLEFHPAVTRKQTTITPFDHTIPPCARAWIVASNYIVRIKINYLPQGEKLPPLHSLPHLEELTLEHLTLDYIFEHNCAGDSSSSPAGPPSGKLFPKLRKLWLRHCPNIRGWWQLPMNHDTNINENNDTIMNIPQFPCLQVLDIREFTDLTWFPMFPTLSKKLYMINGSILHFERTNTMKVLTTSSCNYFKIQKLWLSKLPDLVYMDIELFPHLVYLHLYDCDNFKGWGTKDTSTSTGSKVSSSLSTFKLQNCPRLTCLPKGMNLLGSCTTVKITGCQKLKEKYASKSGPDWPSGVDKTYLTIDW